MTGSGQAPRARTLPRTLRLCLAVAALVALPAGAAAGQEGKRFDLPSARVTADVLPTGAVRVTEEITFAFQGSFSGAYRDVPLREGETMSEITVGEGERTYRPGGSPTIGTPGPAGTFATTAIDGGMRVVWRFAARDEQRTFRVQYLLSGLAVAYDDVVDINLKVWGDQWEQELGRLDATLRLPGNAPGQVRVWGHPFSVKGSTALAPDGSGASLQAERIPAGRFVELRVLFPRHLLTQPSGAKVQPGRALERIVRGEQAAAERAAAEEAQVRWLREHAVGLVGTGLALALAIAGLTGWLLWARYGREPTVQGVPELLTDPPGNEPPAMVAALLDEHGWRVHPAAFPATLFDLIRRGHLESTTIPTERQPGGGQRSEAMIELAVRPAAGGGDRLEPFERQVLAIVEDAMEGEDWLVLSSLQERVKARPGKYRSAFETFENRLRTAVDQKGWWIREGLRPSLAAMGAAWLVALLLGTAALVLRLWLRLPLRTIIVPGWAAGVALVVALLLSAFVLFRRGWERRSEQGAQAAAAWRAFRRFLDSERALREAGPGSTAVWERYLCYAVAFGIAARVLHALRVVIPAERLAASPWVWGYTTHPHLHSDLAKVPAASATSTGGGGEFTGVGGDGGGGGGGGAW